MFKNYFHRKILTNLVKGRKYLTQFKIKSNKIGQQKAKIELLLCAIAKDYDLKLTLEYQGLKPRKYRFDFAFPELKIAIEYEGLNFANYWKGSRKVESKSGHLTIKGYTDNCNKYNLALTKGWVVFRYTAINYVNCYEDLKEYLKNYK